MGREKDGSGLSSKSRFDYRSLQANRQALAGGGLALTLLTGCTMVGPDFLRPSTKLSSEWLEANDPRIETAPATYREWWKAFDDPVLEHLIQTAYEQNLSLRIAGVRVFEARAQLGIAVGEFFPQAQQAFGSTNTNRFSETSPSSPQPGQDTGVGFSYRQAQLGLGASWELDFWGKYRRAIESADANLLSSIAAYDNALVTLTGDVANTYVQIRTLEDRLRIAQENVEIQKESLKIAQARFQGGVASERDVQQAIAELKNTEATVFQLDTQLRQTKNALCTLLGLPPTGLDDVLSGASGIPGAPLEVAVGIPADLLRRRPTFAVRNIRRCCCAPKSGSPRRIFTRPFPCPAASGFSPAMSASSSLAT